MPRAMPTQMLDALYRLVSTSKYSVAFMGAWMVWELIGESHPLYAAAMISGLLGLAVLAQGIADCGKNAVREEAKLRREDEDMSHNRRLADQIELLMAQGAEKELIGE